MRSLAFIIDGEVAEVINYDDHMAAVLLSNPLIVDISNINVTSDGWTFDGSAFSKLVNGQVVSIPAQGR